MAKVISLLERAFLWRNLMAKWQVHRGGCHNCGSPEYGPVLKEFPWFWIADKDEEILCGQCMHLRAFNRLGRKLTRDDLKDVPWNYYRSAVHSDF